MRLIDEKGRLFGKINIIDIAVILFVCSFVLMTYFGYKVLEARNVETANIPRNKINIEVRFNGVIPELVKAMKEGDIEKDIFGRAIARIAHIESVKPAEMIVIFDGKTPTVIPHPSSKDVVAELEVAYTLGKNGEICCSNSPMRIGGKFTFVTNLYTVEGVVISIGDDLSKK